MLRTEQRFKSYSADKMVSVRRATGGAKSYMSIPLVINSWRQQSACVKDKWANWLSVYQAVRVYFIPSPAPPLLMTRTTFVNY